MNAKNTLAIMDHNDLAKAQPIDQNPAAVYLASLTPRAQRVQKDALDRIAGILTNSAINDCLAIPWDKVEYQHAQAIRSALIERHKTATVNA